MKSANALTLDRLDRRILHTLDVSPLSTLSQVAKRLRIGSDLVEYRMKRFIAQGVICRFTPFVNPAALGFGIYKTYIRHRFPKQELKVLLKRLDQHERLHWLIEGYGRWDLLFSLNARSFGEYQRLYDQLIGELGQYILDQGVYPIVGIDRFPKNYLLGQGSGGSYWSSDEDVPLVDDFERRFLSALSEDARSSDVNLAKVLKTTPAVVSYRREKLENSRAIVGYRMQLDYSRLGMVVVKVFLELKSYNPKVRAEIRDFCRDEPTVTCFVQQLGNYPIELELEVEGYEQFAALLDKILDRFSDSIARADHMVITKDHFHRIAKN